MAWHFEEDDAIEFGDREAILMYNFRFWIRKNKANGVHFHDGRTWTYNKISAFPKIFRFWTKDQIRRLIDSLVEQNVLVVGNYNSTPLLQTKWYAFTDEKRFLREVIIDEPPPLEPADLANLPNADGENAKSNCENNQMELAESQNAIGKFANHTYTKPDSKPFKKPDPKTGAGQDFSNEKIWTAEEIVREVDNKNGRAKLNKFAAGLEVQPLAEQWLEYRQREKIPVARSMGGAFLHWIEMRKDEKKSKSVGVKIASSILEETPTIMYNKMYAVLKFFIDDWKNHFERAMPEMSANGWIVKVLDPLALKHQELLQQINVKIEVK